MLNPMFTMLEEGQSLSGQGGQQRTADFTKMEHALIRDVRKETFQNAN
jgi:hypothetical protein